jgi:hypothetical protein|nr:MAG TPA: hypothetical protein [Caudoviricetes sp.]
MVNYSINREKGIVIAWFQEGCLAKRELMEDELDSMLRSRCNSIQMYLLLDHNDIIDKFLDRYNDKNSFVGIAYCNPSDEFDEQIGKDIAFNRLREKEHQMLNKFTFFVRDWLLKFANDHRLSIIPMK